MTFLGMSAWQGWGVMALAAGVTAWIFRLKLRPPRVVVASLLVWSTVLNHPRAMSFWERVRRGVSLAMAVAIAVMLALAATRPSPGAAGATPGRRLIVLDTSVSMRARTANGGTRWTHAVAEARAIARSSGGEEVAVATTAAGVVEGPTSDVALIESALDRIEPGGGDQAVWPRVDTGTVTYFVTDGAVARALAPSVRVRSVFEPAANVAITAFAARPAATTAAGGEAYLEVVNHGPAQRVHLTVMRDTLVVVDRQIDMSVEDVWRQIVPLVDAGGARLQARVSAPNNALDLDDEAVAWLAMADPVTVTLVSDAPAPFARLFEADANVRLTTVRPDQYKPDGADVLIFDRWLPQDAPAQPLLAVAPPSSPWLAQALRDEVAPEWTEASAHPVLTGVDAVPLDIIRARVYGRAGLQPIARSAQGTPLVAVVDQPDRRAVLIGFSLGDSNLTATPVFPVLVGNALDWLAHPVAGETRAPGPIELPTSASRVLGPDGATVPLARAGDRVLAWLRTPGLYRIEAGGSRSVVSVNAGDPAVANLEHTTLDAQDREPSGLQTLGRRPWWQDALMLALVLLSVEWWTWQRRITV